MSPNDQVVTKQLHVGRPPCRKRCRNTDQFAKTRLFIVEIQSLIKHKVYELLWLLKLTQIYWPIKIRRNELGGK